MSRWRAEPLRIALAPGAAALRRGREQQVLTAGERNTAALLSLLDGALAEAVWQGGPVEVVLSQHLVRHVVTDPPRKPLSAAEEHALVAAAFREIYGDAVDAWKIEVLSQPPQHGLLGAAVDAALLEQLDALLTRHGFQRIRIRPLASFAARRLPRRFDGWWALVEPGWLSVFGARAGVWHHALALPVDARWPQTLAELVAREAGGSAVPVSVQAYGLERVELPQSDAVRWQRIGVGSDAGILGLASA